MKGVIEWVKSHLHIVISSALALIGIVLLAMGYTDETITKKLQADVQAVGQLNSLTPANPTVIAAKQATLAKVRKQVDDLNRQVADIGLHKPLLDNVFPKPATTSALLEFKRALREVYVNTFPETLKAKDQPSPAELRLMEEQMKDAEEALKVQERFGDDTRPTTPDTGTTGGPITPIFGGGFGGFGGGGGANTSTRNLAEMTPEELVKENATARISVMRAREIYCYANGDPESPECSFDSQPVLNADRPLVEDMWLAQMSLWIQSDMVNALAGLNNREADALQQRQIRPWVGNLPVKHIVSFNVKGYVRGADAAGGEAPGGSISADDSTFTDRGTTDAVDVLHFDMVLVVDARGLPAVIDEICAAGFYTPLLVNYEVVPPNLTLSGYIYGSAPVVRVTLEMEAALLRSKYETLVPPSIEAERTGGMLFQRRKDGSKSGTGGGMMRPTAPTTPRMEFMPS